MFFRLAARLQNKIQISFVKFCWSENLSVNVKQWQASFYFIFYVIRKQKNIQEWVKWGSEEQQHLNVSSAHSISLDGTLKIYLSFYIMSNSINFPIPILMPSSKHHIHTLLLIISFLHKSIHTYPTTIHRYMQCQ